MSVIRLGFGSVRSRVCLWTLQNARETRAGSVVSLPESSEEEPGLLQIGGSFGRIYYHYWSCQLRFNTGLQTDVSGPASSLPYPSTGSQLQSHLCSFNPLISPERRVRSEAAVGSADQSSGHCLGSTTSPSTSHSQEVIGAVGVPEPFGTPEQMHRDNSSRIRSLGSWTITLSFSGLCYFPSAVHSYSLTVLLHLKVVLRKGDCSLF